MRIRSAPSTSTPSARSSPASRSATPRSRRHSPPGGPAYSPRSRASLDVDYCDDNDRWVDALDCVLDGRQALVVAFEVDLLEGYQDWFYSSFCALCRSSGLRELTVLNTHAHECYDVPSPVYACETVTTLELYSCHFRVPGKLTGLRAVRSLVLRQVVATDADLRRMISRCRAVERLVLDDCRRVRNVVIRGRPSLKELEIYSYHPLRIAMKKAPFLHSVKLSLSYAHPDGDWSIYDNPDSDIARKRSDYDAVEELFDFEELQEREHEKTDEATNIVTFVSGLGCAREIFLNLPYEYAEVLSKTSNSLPMKLPKKCYLRGLQKLTLVLNHNDRALSKVVSLLLNSSPNLKDLEIIDPNDDHCTSCVEPEIWEKRNVGAECVQNHLSTVTLYMRGKRTEYCPYIGFLKFLVMQARFLKRLSIKYERSKDHRLYADELEVVQRELQLCPRVSPDALVEISPRLPWF